MSEDKFNSRGEESTIFYNGRAILPPVLLGALHKDNSHFQSRPKDHTVSEVMGMLDTWGGIFRDPNGYQSTEFKFKLVKVSSFLGMFFT